MNHHKIVVVGTGFAGLGMAVRLRQRGERDFVVLDRAKGPGGTWRDNTYPGCQCDVPSNLYSFSFALKPDWSSTFPLQSEILDYLRETAERFSVTEHLRYGHELLDARWEDDTHRWHLSTTGGDLSADVLVLGLGAFGEPSTPDLPGFERFARTVFHSARWDHDHDLTGERVAVIGTGASAIQIVPNIQPTVGHLDVYQRTAPWVLPHPNRPTTKVERTLYRRFPALQRLVRAWIYAARELLVLALAKQPRLARPIERLGRAHLRRSVKDHRLRRRLQPRFALGCKRILISNDWYPALEQPNVEVVTDGIAEITETGIVTTDGTERPVDTIVLATGFKVTDNPTYGRIKGRDGETLLDAFDRAGAYVGTTAAGFPNLFCLAGPNTGIGHTSLVYMIESQIAYVMDALRTMASTGAAAVEVRAAAHQRFFEEVQERSRTTVWASGCGSWYLDAKGHNLAIWPDFTWKFRRRVRTFDAGAYELTPRP